MKRSHLAVLLAIVAVNLLFKLQHITYSSFDLDEAVHIWFAQLPFDEVLAHAKDDPNPPLYHFLISAWVKTFGVTELAVRWFSLLFSALAAGALFFFLKRHLNMRVAVIAAVLFTVSAIQVRYAHNARPYTMLIFLVICSYGMVLELLRRPTRWKYVAYAAVTSLMLYAHPTSVFNLPAQALFLLPRLRSDRRTVLLIGVSQVVAVGSYLAWHLTNPFFKMGIGTWLLPPTWVDALLALQLLNGSDWYNHVAYVQLGLLVVAVALLIRYRDAQQMPQLLLGLCWAIVPLLGNYVFSHVGEPIFQAKYVMSTQVGLVVLMAVCIDALRWQWLRWPVFGAVAVLMYTHIDWKATSGEDWRGAVALVRADNGPGTATFVHPWFEFRSFAYYFDREAFKDPPTTAKSLVDSNVFTAWHDVVAVGAGIPKFSRLHFVYSQPGAGDMRPLLDSLRQNATLVSETRLEGVTVFTFDLRAHPSALHLDFEDRNVATNVFDGIPAFAGSGAEWMDHTREFSTTISCPMELLSRTDTIVDVTVAIQGNEGLEGVFLVAALERDGQNLANYQIPIDPQAQNAKDWQSLKAEFRYEKAKHASAQLKAFVWNPAKRNIRIDELKVSVR